MRTPTLHSLIVTGQLDSFRYGTRKRAAIWYINPTFLRGIILPGPLPRSVPREVERSATRFLGRSNESTAYKIISAVTASRVTVTLLSAYY
jgi:hypothetical protein